MIHQSSSGFQGTYADAKVSFEEWTKINNLIFELISTYCDKSFFTVQSDAQRDYWMSSEETLQYGLIDEVVKKRM